MTVDAGTTENNDVSARNFALATEIMQRFGRDMDGWYDHLHDDIVMEFPFGPSVGMPAFVKGKEACSATFKTVCEAIQVQFDNIVVHSTADPATLIVEYTGLSHPNGRTYDQTYISVQRFQDGKMILFKEYWNAKVVLDTFGDLTGLLG